MLHASHCCHSPDQFKRCSELSYALCPFILQHVIKLFDVIDSPKQLFLVMEHAPAGSLLDFVRARKRLPELDACAFFQQIVAGLQYCHSREVVHRWESCACNMDCRKVAML